MEKTCLRVVIIKILRIADPYGHTLVLYRENSTALYGIWGHVSLDDDDGCRQNTVFCLFLLFPPRKTRKTNEIYTLFIASIAAESFVYRT